MILVDPFAFIFWITVIAVIVGMWFGARRQRAMNNRNAAFTAWWRDTGSGMFPLPNEDAEAHACRVAAHAWDAGFAQRDAA